jgi:diacylglycerol diphosphate phosphatase/phosphatidate phosphatase
MKLADFYFLLKKYAIFDWLAVIIFLVAGILIEMMDFGEDFSNFISSDINNPKRSTTVPYKYLCIYTFGVGAFITLCIWVMTRRDYTISSLLSSYYFSLCFTLFVSSCLKHLVGRPRPDTKSVCGLDGSYLSCTGVLSGHELSDQFHSFPSGHAAESMAVGIFMTLLLSDIWVSGSMLSAMFKMAPVVWAIFIGVTRIWDRAHHVDDVIAGLFLGAVVGFFTYKTFKVGISIDLKRPQSAQTETSVSPFSAYV